MAPNPSPSRPVPRDTHLVACCLRSTGLKISPSALALSRFLGPLRHTLEKCRSRQWRVSQYWAGRLGELAMLLRRREHSSGVCVSIGQQGGRGVRVGYPQQEPHQHTLVRTL